MLEVEVAGETLHLLPERAVYWPRRKTLLVADVHLGKATTFRKAGIALPGDLTSANLTRLSDALSACGAERLICLGDWLHARQGQSATLTQQVTAWRQRWHTLTITLIRGNHDIRAGPVPPTWRIEQLEEPQSEPPFVWRHMPQSDPNGYVLAGHLHPAVVVGRGKLAERLPCFHFRHTVATLPAFGEFTGSATVKSKPGDRVYAVADRQVMRIA